jgi:ergothioneine biosynthesis protein EgtB
MIEPLDSYLNTRDETLAIIEKLSPEDCLVQASPEISPLKWHLAHTTWFWAQFILQGHLPEGYAFLFNSYYNSIGERTDRLRRGFQSRPSLNEVICWRREIDEKINDLLNATEKLPELYELGIQHEKQHQELMLMDLQLNFFLMDCQPAAFEGNPSSFIAPDKEFKNFSAGLYDFGNGVDLFSFDNEQPQHKRWIDPFLIRNSLVTNSDYREFIQDGGYANSSLWLSDGWDWIKTANHSRPLYWSTCLETEFTLFGWIAIDPNAPVRHLSFYEAEAFAKWSGFRLPTEFEWELAAADIPLRDQKPFPVPQQSNESDFYYSLWQFTNSSYEPYPGFLMADGAVGEYNGKFMNNQRVLRGGCCFSPQKHIRKTYRNFFYPFQNWMASGIRLAK